MKIKKFSLKLTAILLAGTAALFAAGAFSGCVNRNYGPNYEKWYARERVPVPAVEDGIRADFSSSYIRELAHFLPLVPDTEKFEKSPLLLESKRIQEFDENARVSYGRRISVVDTRTGEKISEFEVWSDSSAEKVAKRVRAAISAGSKYAAAKAAKEAARERAISRFAQDAAEQGKILYVGSDDVFGWLFCAKMQNRGWKCISVKSFADIPTADAERESQYLLKFSGRRSRSDFAEEVAGTLVDLRTGKEFFSVRRSRISAENFSDELTKIFNRKPEPETPQKTSPKTYDKNYEK